jgi:hypothetical protein
MHFIYAHLIGDYLLQSDWMAKGKKVSSWICLVHIVAYMIPFLFCGLVWWQLLLIGVQHYLQDRTNFIAWLMKIKGSAEFAKPPMAPWSIIVTDNIVHILFIAFVAYL